MKGPRKNKSNLSTMHMSGNVSAKTGTPSDQKIPTPLYYASIPIKKDVPNWNQSSATWRHSSHRYSFSKSSRFKDNKPYYFDILEPQLPDTKTTKTCSFGKGKKRPISETVLRNAKEKPSPDCYHFQEFDEQSRKPEKGKTIGISWEDYEKVYIQHRKDVYSRHFTKNNPPAHYSVREKPGKNTKSFSAYGRLKMYTQKMADGMRGVPGPVHQIRDSQLGNRRGLNERSLGVGERMDLSAPLNRNPGAEYELQGFCDKYVKMKGKSRIQG